MYTVTFYSFKGGVGRTLALVNAATLLAGQGHTVCLIDFDLEAPGLSTFDLLRAPTDCHPGVVEFISEYIQTGRTPALDRYVYQARPLPRTGAGPIFIMPAGREDDSYRHALSNLDWGKLYDQRDGFLFLEDTKRQIERRFRPDYLLIDSRTGHTDVEGICTRQLPNAVIIMFFPNEQNLSGLKAVCRSIRQERDTGLRKDITLHFVMSNVPDLDDEDEILRKRIRSFREELDFQRLTATIHRYESLALLNQSIFAIERPRSRLAQQYRRLISEVVKSNPADRLGVLSFLEQKHRSARTSSVLASGEEKQLSEIIQYFHEDSEVLTAVAQLNTDDGLYEQAISLLDQALSANPDFAEGRIQRAYCRQRLGKLEESLEDLFHCCLNISGIDPALFVRAFRGLLAFSPGHITALVRSPSMMALDCESRGVVLKDLCMNDETWRLALELIPSHLSTLRETDERYRYWKNEWILLLIRARNWDEAISASGSVQDQPGRFRKALAFNLAMALWAKSGELRKDLMELVQEGEATGETDADPNHEQCLALTYWAIGRGEEAMIRIQRAISLAKSARKRIFSCWKYAPVPPRVFVDDCEKLVQMFLGEKLLPEFLENRDRNS